MSFGGEYLAHSIWNELEMSAFLKNDKDPEKPVGSSQPAAIGRIAENFPDLSIVISHLMSPRRNHRTEWEEGLKIMKKNNISFDLAALHHKVRPENYPFPTEISSIRESVLCAGGIT